MGHLDLVVVQSRVVETALLRNALAVFGDRLLGVADCDGLVAHGRDILSHFRALPRLVRNYRGGVIYLSAKVWIVANCLAWGALARWLDLML